MNKILITIFLITISIYSRDSYMFINGKKSNLKKNNLFISLKLNNSISKSSLKKQLYLIKYLPKILKIKELSKNTYIIKFKYELSNKIINYLKTKYEILNSYSINSTDWPLVESKRINIKFKKNISLIQKNKILSTYNLRIQETFSFNKNTYVVRSNKNTFEVANNLFNTGFFEYSYPDFYTLLKRKFIPNDKYYNSQWQYKNNYIGVSLESAWDINKGNKNIKIAILDDGADLKHEDLIQNIILSKDFTNKGFNDSGEHGTSCAGIIGAKGNNSLGITGSCMNCSLIIAKVMPSDGYVLESTMVNAFNWVSSSGADIINNSWGFDRVLNVKKLYPMLVDTINNILQNGRNGKGEIIVFASGNENREFYSNSLEGLNGIITVGATDYHGSRAYYSNYGTMLDFIAPSSTGYLGSDKDAIWTTDITGENGYNNNGSAYQYTDTGKEYLGEDIDSEGKYTKYFGGTSAAAPLVSGIIGLMLSENPNLTSKQVYNILKETTDKIGSGYDENNHSKYLGYGKINALKALSYINSEVEACKDISCSNHGVCIKIENEISCNCTIGYHNKNLECIKNEITSLCNNISCSNHGKCIIKNNLSECKCDKGYYNNGITCIKNKDNDSCNYGTKNISLILYLIFLILFYVIKRNIIKKGE